MFIEFQCSTLKADLSGTDQIVQNSETLLLHTNKQTQLHLLVVVRFVGSTLGHSQVLGLVLRQLSKVGVK